MLLLITIVVVGTLVAVSMLGGRFGALQQLTLDAIGPLQKGATHLKSSIANFSDTYVELWNVRDQRDHLQEVNKKYLQELSEYREGYSKYLHYEELLKFKRQQGFGLLTARVVGRDPDFWCRTIVIDRGKKDDVVEGMSAVSPGGVVGQVIHAADHYSKVLLANAPSSAIDALVQKNRTRGIIKGTGSGGYVMQYVLKNVDVAVGDDIVTAGIGGVFKSGIPLGKVAEVHHRERGMFLEIVVEPSVDFQKLEVLFVDLNDSNEAIEEMSLEAIRQAARRGQ